jgi:hypothetical protein
MINVNQMTSQLARMPDQALQQYAQMHKNDPYIMALAMSESNRRKTMRTGAQMNAPEEPKVVDKALQSMAAPMPEDVGIGQLPTGNMNFAEGGIVAFSDGGDVPRYQDRGLVDVYSLGASPDALERRRKAMMRAMLEETARARETVAQGSEYSPERYGVTTPAPAFNDPRIVGATPPKQSVGAPSAPPPAAPKVAAGNRPASGPELLSGPSGAEPASGQSIYSLASTPSTYQRELDQFLPQGKVVDPFEADVRAQGEAEEKVAREYAAKRKQQLEGMGLLGLDQEKRLKAREGKLSKQEGDLGPMALMQAGFAMMSGASPNALQNIGVGAQAGLKKYSEGIERLGEAREKIDDAFGRLDIARRSEKMLTDKEISDLERDTSKVVSQTRREVTNSARTAYGLKVTEAGKLFDAYVADKRLGAELASRKETSEAEMKNRLVAAGIAARGPQNLYEALGSAKPDSPLLKGYGMSKQEGQVPRLYGEYAKLVADPMNGPAFEQKYPTFQAFMAAMGGAGGGGFVTPPKNAPVLRPPGS